MNTTNTITLNESAITSLSNFYNKTTSDGRYLQLSGGNMTGSLTIGGSLQVNTNTTISGSLQVNTNANISGSLQVNTNANISGNLTGATNVSKRTYLTFTPTQVLTGLGFRYVYTINLSSYMTALDVGWGAQYTFRIIIWTYTGDYGDSVNNVESMEYLIFLSNYAGGKYRINQIYNQSNGSFISFSSYNTIYYNGWNGTGGASTKVCVIENISSY